MSNIELFNKTEYGKAALKKLNNPENFFIYECESVDKCVMKCTGAEFRKAKTGKNKGEFSIIIPNTKQITYVIFNGNEYV